MRDDDDYDGPEPTRRSRSSGPGWFAVVSLSLITSVVASFVTVVAIARVPALQSMTTGAASAHAAASNVAVSVDAGVVMVSVPNLVRVPQDNVRSIAEGMGLRLIVNERHEQSEIPAGLVAAQAPRAGTSVARGSDLVVVLSAGPGEADAGVASAQTTPTPAIAADDAGAAVAGESVVVPSVYRLYVREARSRLTLSGLTLGEERRGGYDEDMSPGRILRQTPAAGARASRGTAVHVWVNQE